MENVYKIKFWFEIEITNWNLKKSIKKVWSKYFYYSYGENFLDVYENSFNKIKNKKITSLAMAIIFGIPVHFLALKTRILHRGISCEVGSIKEWILSGDKKFILKRLVDIPCFPVQKRIADYSVWENFICDEEVSENNINNKISKILDPTNSIFSFLGIDSIEWYNKGDLYHLVPKKEAEYIFKMQGNCEYYYSKKDKDSQIFFEFASREYMGLLRWVYDHSF